LVGVVAIAAAAGLLALRAFAGRDEESGRPPVVWTEPTISPAAIRVLSARAERCRSSLDASLHDPFCVALARGPSLSEVLSGQARRIRVRTANRSGGS
jgi:hypothetical protein